MISKSFWFLFAAIFLFCFAFDLMLNRPDSNNKDDQVRVINAGRSKPETTKIISGKVGLPVGSVLIEPAGKSTPILPQAPADTSPNLVFENEKPELAILSEGPVSDHETVDIQVIEDRLLEEQIAESNRNPAYLSGAYYESLETVVQEDSEEKVNDEDMLGNEVVESFGVTQLVDGGTEEGPQDDNEANISEADQTEEEVLITESGFPAGSYYVNFSEVEDQMLAAQIEESLKNPAHLPNLLAEYWTETTEDQE